MVGAAESADIVFAAVAEIGIVGAEDILLILDAILAITIIIFIGNIIIQSHFFLGLEVDDIKVGIDGTALMATEIYLLVFLVDAADIDDIKVPTGYLTNQLAVHAIKINMVVSVFLAGDEE